ncbi:hypothetical protein AVEN_137416-1 [Araneus ventricosus]|uniref:Uncharacterized protein n=1 Tax=Araneus ventricosus TaxID=182803 RepID=A0A4Y2UBM8_ARAVE|nr:hypothetical protein AVEN_238905-1 [Araneus ventricosus]GBO09481.1 hypothetical protein AVEN_249706-1 [Araneus ventricosus]GBO09875.1 hypothetical protein AVEN_34253-1 [Araneus ventricosus]GBO09883.1 hypothetical protein AVEN_137416-1 [Araneus ventricosus]
MAGIQKHYHKERQKGHSHKRYVPFFEHNSLTLRPLLEKRNTLESTRNSTGIMTEEQRIQLNKVNAEIKRAYALSRRKKWEKLCGNLDPKTPDSRLWRIAKGLNRVDIMSERTNTILDPAGYMTHNDKDAANALATHYQKIGSLDCSETDRHTQRKARAVVHGFRTTDSKEIIFTKEFSFQELEQALSQMD